MTTATKTKQINMRATNDVHALLSEAAGVYGESLSAFTLKAALERAESVLDSRELARAIAENDPTGRSLTTAELAAELGIEL